MTETLVPIGRVETMGGLAKGLAIVEMFGAGAEKLTVADAARGSGTTRAAARRCLLTLADLGYVTHDGRYFVPLPRLRRLGRSAINRASLVERAQPILAHARDQLQESISLAILEGRESLFIARAESSHIVQTGVRLGVRMPAYATATGRLLLGELSDPALRSYLAEADIIARTPRSVVDPARLFAIIVAARESGICYNDEELELGMRAMAVRVRQNGETIAAISLSALTLRSSIEEMAVRYRPVLDQAAAELAR